MKNSVKPFARTVCFLGAMFLGVSSAQADVSEAQAFVCENGGETREIAVDFAPGNKLPCSVNYTKYGQKKTLWRAHNEANYCGVRAQELIAKLERTGWQCDLSKTEEIAKTASQQGEDTAVMAPTVAPTTAPTTATKAETSVPTQTANSNVR